MREVERRARMIGARGVERAKARVAAALRERLGDAVREGEDGVEVRGRGAVERMLADPALRWIAGLLK